MTDSQIELISKLVSDLKDFEDSVMNKTRFSNNPNLVIEYLENEAIILTAGMEKISVKKGVIKGLIDELKQQEKRSTNSKENYNPLLELKELANGQYEMSEEYYTDMVYARQVSSGYGAYKRKLIEISKIFLSGNTLKHKEEHFLNRDEFTNGLLAKLPDFKSIEDELRN